MKNRKTFRISPPLNKVDKPPKLNPSVSRRSSSFRQSVANDLINHNEIMTNNTICKLMFINNDCDKMKNMGACYAPRPMSSKKTKK